MTESHPTVGYIGSGWTERVQIPAFQLGGLAAQAICSGNPENARRVAAKFAIPEVHEDWRSLIESSQVDIVSIVTLAQALATALGSANPQLTDAATFYDGLVVQWMLDAARVSHTQQQWVSL